MMKVGKKNLIDRDTIAAMIPHAGSMCLLDAVLRWDETTVQCLSRRYRDSDNPLRRADGRLGAASGIEIAAQAMAVHGRLRSDRAGAPMRGYLASLRDVRLGTQYLDVVDDDLVIDADILMGDASGASYRFALLAGGHMLVSGRATIVLEPAA
jgi:predicted hotdog family 3-hydroxylacyl-ACP dehydratase